jgi:predicted ribosomally synthesized peptide with SipW-like signal peptide
MAVTRSVFTSFIIIAAVVALVTASATFAPFTDESTSTGSFTSGTVDVVVNNDTDDVVTLNFTGAACANMAAGETCQATLDVQNAGSLSATYDVTVADSNPACFTSSLNSAATLEAGQAPDNDQNPGVVHAGIVSTTLAEDNACQGAVNTVTVTVAAAQSATPHD